MLSLIVTTVIAMWLKHWININIKGSQIGTWSLFGGCAVLKANMSGIFSFLTPY